MNQLLLKSENTRLLEDLVAIHSGYKESELATPHVWVVDGDNKIPISIEGSPRILEDKKLNPIQLVKIQSTFDYVSKHHIVFLKYWRDEEDKFGDSELIAALISRGDYSI